MIAQDEMDAINETAGLAAYNTLPNEAGMVLITYEVGGAMVATGQTCTIREAVDTMRCAADLLEEALNDGRAQ